MANLKYQKQDDVALESGRLIVFKKEKTKKEIKNA